MKIEKITPSLICIVLVACNPAFAAASVGVQQGDWMRYDVTVSAAGQSVTTSIKITIQNVTGTSVTGTYEESGANAQTTTENFTKDLASDCLIRAYPFIVPANLTTGDRVYIGYVSYYTITDTIQHSSGRDAAFFNYSISGSSTLVYWDREKGVLLESMITGGVASTTIKLAETSLWGTYTILGLDWRIFTAIIVVIVAALAGGFLLMRRRKPLTPSPPPAAQLS